MNLLIVYALIFLLVFIILGIKLGFKNKRYLISAEITLTIIIIGVVSGVFPTNTGKCGNSAFYIYNIYKTVRVYGDETANLSSLNKDVNKIIIHNGIDGIEGCGFSNLTYIDMADSIVSIGDNTFYGCNLLENVKLPKNLKYIRKNAFYGCKSIANIEIPESVECICSGAFSFTNISEISIPDNTLFNVYDNTYAYARAYDENTFTFYGCSNLKKINISENNKNYINVDGVIFNKDKTTIECYPAGKDDKEYVIPNTVQNVEQLYTFAYCNNLKKLTISNIELINKYLIYECENLEIIEIEDGVKNILPGAIQECYNISEIYIKGNTEISDYDSKDFEFINNKSNDKVSKEITIYCKADSNAQQYAQKHNLKYVITENE